MKLKINGEINTIEDLNKDLMLESLLEKLGYKPQLVVVELNGEIINPKLWISTVVNDGDIIEIVTIVGGGAYS